MFKRSLHLMLVLLILFLSKSVVYAQFIYPFSDDWSVGANMGLTYFYGDVNDDKGRIWNNTPFSRSYYAHKNIMVSTNLSKAMSRNWGIRGNLSYGKISGSNENTNMYFEGTVYSLDIGATFQYIDFFIIRPPSSKFKYYALAGTGFSNFSTIRRDLSTNVFQNGMGYNNEGVFTDFSTEVLIKIGLGFGYQLDKVWLINFETTLNYLYSDNLDAYISTASFLEGYGYMSLGIVYKFDLNIKTPANSLKKSSGYNNRSYNSGIKNKRKL